jgi:hypothetical protein
VSLVDALVCLAFGALAAPRIVELWRVVFGPHPEPEEGDGDDVSAWG